MMRFLIGLAVLLTAVSWLVLSTLDRVSFHQRADEGCYLTYASRIAEKGFSEYPKLLSDYAARGETTRFSPSPLRLVPILLGAAAVRLGGVFFTSLSVLSLAAFLVLLILLAAALRRALGTRMAFWFLPVLAFSPLHLDLARRALSDTLMSLFLLGSLWLFLFTSEERPRSILRWGVVALVYAATFLVKESAFLLTLISVSFLLWRWRSRGESVQVIPLLAVSVLPLLLAAGIVGAAGGFAETWQVLKVFSSGATVNEYAQQYQNGPWFRFVVDFLLISPWSTGLYLVWLGMLFAEPVRDGKILFWAMIPIVTVALVSLFPFGKNIRFVLFLEMPIRMGGFFALWRLARMDREVPARRGVLLALLLAAFLATDLQNWWNLFVRGGIYDPVSFRLLLGRGFLPR